MGTQITQPGRIRNRASNLAKTTAAELEKPTTQSKAIALKGVTTDRDFANLMNAIISDLAQGSLSTEVGNAMVNAGGKLLKVVEMRLRYGTKDGESKVLTLRQPD